MILQIGIEPPQQSVEIDRRLLEILICPVTRTPLSYDRARQELVSKAGNCAFPIRNGIPIMVLEEVQAIAGELK